MEHKMVRADWKSSGQLSSIQCSRRAQGSFEPFQEVLAQPSSGDLTAKLRLGDVPLRVTPHTLEFACFKSGKVFRLREIAASPPVRRPVDLTALLRFTLARPI